MARRAPSGRPIRRCVRQAEPRASRKSRQKPSPDCHGRIPVTRDSPNRHTQFWNRTTGRPMDNFREALRTQRWDDHRYYHHSRINQSLHFVSAISFLFSYVMIFKDPAISALAGWLVAMTTRQTGHFFFEPKGYDTVNQATHEHKEEIKVGYNLKRKVILHAVWILAPFALWVNPTLFGIFEPKTGAAAFMRHVGEIWLVVGIGALL